MIRTVFMCELEALAVLPKQHSSTAMTAAARKLDRFWWAPVLAKINLSAPAVRGSGRRCSTLVGLSWQTEQRDRSCVSPSGSPAERAPGQAGWRANQRGARAG